MNEIIRFDELDSTNDYLKENHDSFDDQTIVVTKKQTSGRGRLDRVWTSEIGNLYMSILYKNGKVRDEIFNVMINVSVSIVDLLKQYKIDAKIKYPNDILVDGKKIAGVLIESRGSNDLDYIIVGIGLNVNQVDFKELNNKATSICKIINRRVQVDSILSELRKIISQNEFVLEDYIKHSLILGRTILHNDIRYNVKNIDKFGNLILVNNDEEIMVKVNEISLKEIYDELNN